MSTAFLLWPFCPPKISRTIFAFSSGVPPFKSSFVQRSKPKSSGEITVVLNHPSFISHILGDVLSMIEKAQENIDEEQAKKLEQKMRKNEFDFEMYLDSMSQMKKMGGLSSVMGMMPGMGIGGGKMPDIDTDEAEKGMARTEAIIYSMTPEERRNPKLLNPSRKARIARGAGVDVSEVNRLVKQFEQTKKFMKQMPGMMGGKKGRRGGGGLGGLFKGLPF